MTPTTPAEGSQRACGSSSSLSASRTSGCCVPTLSTDSARYSLAMQRRRSAVIGVLVAAIGLAGCGSDEAGFGLPRLSANDAASVLDVGGRTLASVTGALNIESNGCFTWESDDADSDGSWIVWPEDAAQDGGEVLLGSRERVGDGDQLSVNASTVLLDELPSGDDPDSYFGSFGHFCGADQRGVLLVTEVRAR